MLILLAVLFFFMVMSSIFVVSACMLSSQRNQEAGLYQEERYELASDTHTARQVSPNTA